MKITLLIVIAILAIIVTFGISLYFYPQLPEQMPSHWNLQGQINGYMPKNVELLFAPLLMTGMLVLFQVLPKLDPCRANYAFFRKEYEIIQLGLIVFFGFIHLLVIYASLHQNFPVSSLIIMAVGALFVLIGSCLLKIRQNYFIGIRVPWTINNEENWNKTHQFGGWCFIVAGLVLFFMGILPSQLKLVFLLAPILVAALLPVGYSYWLYRQSLAH